MNILLTGATGFLGFRTLEELVQLTYIKKIIATGRTLIASRKIQNEKVKYILGDLTEKKFVDSLVKDIDIIINNAALSSPWGSFKQFYRANIKTQKNIIEASKKNGIKRIIYISSASIYYNGKNRQMVKESDDLPRRFVNNYAKTKREAEILLQKSNIQYIIIRPRAIIGRGDSVIMPRLIKAYSNGKLKIMGNGKNTVDLTSVKNVAHAIILSLKTKPDACNNIYNITDGKPICLWNYINKVFKGIGREEIRSNINPYLAYYVAYIMEMIAKYFTKKEPSLTRYSVGVLSKDFTLDISKAKRLLNYQPIVTTKQSLNEFIIWHKNNE